jgi:hypothetical protein
MLWPRPNAIAIATHTPPMSRTVAAEDDEAEANPMYADATAINT